MPGLEPLEEEEGSVGVAVMVAVAIVIVVALPESYSSTPISEQTQPAASSAFFTHRTAFHTQQTKPRRQPKETPTAAYP